jgi:uncharacterized repeat protein (TIGR01451 family)
MKIGFQKNRKKTQGAERETPGRKGEAGSVVCKKNCALGAPRSALRVALLFSVVAFMGLWCAVAQQQGPGSRMERSRSQGGDVMNFSELAAREDARARGRRGAGIRSRGEGEQRRKGAGVRRGISSEPVVPLVAASSAETAPADGINNPLPLTDPLVFVAASAPPSPPPSASFLALPDNDVSFNPDTQGAVGPNHLMVTLGSQVRIQNRAGGVISTVSLDAFWGSLGSSNVFDPRLIYDAKNQRWLTTAIANPATNNAALLLAVSETSDPTGNWFRHQIRVDLTDGVYASSPNLGLGEDWVIISASMRDKTGLFFFSADIFIFNRTNLYAGANPVQFSRKVYAPSDSTIGEVNIPVPAVNFDLNGAGTGSVATNFLVANWDGSLGGGPGRLRLFSVSGPVQAPVFEDYAAQGGLFVSAGLAWGNPSWIGTPPGNTNFAPQLGSPSKIFIGDARIQNVVFRNGLLWCAHHIFLPTNAPTRAAVQWWSITPGGTVLQHGRMDDATGVRFYAYPSIAVNQYDDVLLGYSRFAANQYPSANYAFHPYQETPGRLTADTVLKPGEAKFAIAEGTDVLWGDWSGSVVDPANDTDLWTIQEYAALPVAGIDRWGTWWGRISPPVNLSMRAADSPDPVLAGANVTYSIQVTNNAPHLATGVRLVDTLPPGAVFVSASASQGVCGHTNGVVTCNFGDVAGSSVGNVVVVSATVVAQLNQGGTATNSLSLLTLGPEANPADNSLNVATAVTTAADLAVSMVAEPAALVVLSNNVTYTLTVTNRGPLAAGSASLTNVLPAGLAFVSATPTVGSCSHAAGRVVCTFATLGVNAGARVALVARAITSGFLTNQANAVSSSLDPAPGNNSALAAVKASAAPTLQGMSSARTILEDTVLGPLAFTVGDLETPAASLVVTAASSNPALVPTNNIVFGGSGTDRFFAVTPLPNMSGVTDITRTVRDGDGLAASNTFRLTVTAVPDPPVISDILPQTVNEDTVIGPLNFTIGDVETAATSLNVAAASSNPALIPNANIQLSGSGSNRLVTVRPTTNQSGSATITITVSDGVSTANDMFLVTVNPVNDLPTINDVGNRTLLEDSAGTTIGLAIGDVETAVTALVMSGTSSNLSLVPNGNITFVGTGASRTVTVIPAPNQFGISLITLTVTDSNNGSRSDTFLLTVNPVNDPPTLATNAPLTISEDAGTTNVTLTGISTGAGNELQTNVITATSSRPGLIPHPTVSYTSPNPTGTLSFAPVADSNGVATITVTVNDGGASNNILTRTFNVTVNAVNDAPSISGLTNEVTISEDGATGVIPFVIGDVESAATALTVFGHSANTALVPDANLVFGGTGANRTVTVTSAANQSGETTIMVLVSDGAATNTGTFRLTVLAVNDLPSISIATNQMTVNEDQPANINLNIGDLETAAAGLTLTALSSNPSLTPNISFTGTDSNRTANIVPATNLSGSATIVFTVVDADGGSNNVNLLLNILPVDDPPTLAAIGDLSIAEDAPLQSVLLSGISSGASNETQPLAVTAVSGNSALIPNPAVIYSSANSTGRLEFAPLPNASGIAVITVFVSDGAATNSRVFNVTVTAVNDPPSISAITDREIDEDTTASVPFTVSDLETPADQLNVRAASSNPELLDDTGISFTGSGNNRTLLLTPLPDQSGGSTTITITVSDGSNETAVASFDLTVRSVNDAPSISGLADLTVNGGTTPPPMPFTVSDAESLPSSLTVTAFSSNPGLIPDANIVATGNGSSRTLNLTPLAGQSGTSTIRVVVRDGAGSATNSFQFTVTAIDVTLSIMRSGNIAVVSWPTNRPPSWTLQSTTNLAPVVSWSNVATIPVVTNGRYTVTNALNGKATFYRLGSP